MKLSKEQIATVSKAAKKTKSSTRLVRLPDQVWQFLSESGLRIPDSTFTISGFLYGKSFDFVRYAKNLARDKAVYLVSLILARLGCYVEVVDNEVQINNDGLYILNEIANAQVEHIEDIALIIDNEPVTRI